MSPTSPITRPAASHATSTPFETVADEVFRRYGRVWKSATLKVNRVYLRNQILPWFGDRSVSDINRAEVREWFGALHATPAAANRSLPVLSVIMREAEAYGYRLEDSNPCRGIPRYREVRRERFLTGEETLRLGRHLVKHGSETPLTVALVRLLLLTGCRQSEIRTLRWREFREGHLFLGDSKTGPRTVWLSSPARRTLDVLPRAGEFVFPARGRGSRPMSTDSLHSFWRRLRTDAGFPDLRLHDLRHTYASFALRRQESVVTIGRLLGHRDPRTTLRYTHFDEPMLRRSVETVARALG